MKKISLTFALLLAGCAAYDSLDDGLSALVGLDKTAAFAALGYPDQQQVFDGTKVYTWLSDSNGVAAYSTPQTTYGTVGRRTFQATTFETRYLPVTYRCKIQIATDTKGVIQSYNYDGNPGGCDSYNYRLNRYFKN